MKSPYSRDGLTCQRCHRPVICWRRGFKHAVGSAYRPLSNPHRPEPIHRDGWVPQGAK